MTEKTEDKKQSVYERLSKINVKPYLKEIKKTYKDKQTGQMKSFKLDYLSWAQAWGLVKAIYPDADYKIREYPNWVRTSDGTFQQAGTLDYRITSVGCEVEVTAIIEGVNYTQKLYPMNAKNEPIPNPSIKDINKAQMRCLVKALAFAGLGLNVYAGEDLPSEKDETPTKISKAQQLKEKIANAQRFEVQYGGGKEKLVDVVSWEKSGDKQAHMFIETWTKRDPKNLAAYGFIEANGLYTVKGEKKEAQP